MRSAARWLLWLSMLASGSLTFSAWADVGRSVRAVQQLPERVFIAGGWFTMGSDAAEVEQAQRTCLLSPLAAECSPELFENEQPAHEVYLRPFSIDRSEVSNAAYLRCVSAGACLPTATAETDMRIGQAAQPASALTWEDARSYCRWAKGDLPSEAQWEYAARGASRRAFPWGQAWNSRLANYGEAEGSDKTLDGYRYAAPVTAYPDGKSFFGLLNMAGNVWEYVLDRYAGPYSTTDNRIDPEGAKTGTEHVIRGGSWRSSVHTLRARFRGHLPQSELRPDVGFRCAYAVPVAG